jgi:diketogulonate reductase-like aldo/keto reductase
MTDTADTPEIIDVVHVSCGLIPLMQTHLGGTEPEVEVVEFKVHQGIETELWSSFGTGRDWVLVEIRKELFHDIAKFTRVEQNDLDPLGLLDF